MKKILIVIVSIFIFLSMYGKFRTWIDKRIVNDNNENHEM